MRKEELLKILGIKGIFECFGFTKQAHMKF
jgi:hypothetical protein